MAVHFCNLFRVVQQLSSNSIPSVNWQHSHTLDHHMIGVVFQYEQSNSFVTWLSDPDFVFVDGVLVVDRHRYGFATKCRNVNSISCSWAVRQPTSIWIVRSPNVYWHYLSYQVLVKLILIAVFLVHLLQFDFNKYKFRFIWINNIMVYAFLPRIWDSCCQIKSSEAKPQTDKRVTAR